MKYYCKYGLNRVARLIFAGALCGVYGLVTPVLARAEGVTGTADTAPVSAATSTDKIQSVAELEEAARGGVLNACIPSIDRPLAPIWEWSRQRIAELTSKYAHSLMLGADTLSIVQAEAEALANDHTLKASKYSTEVSHYGVKTAEAGLYPTLTFTGSAAANGTLNTSSSSTYIDTSSSSGRMRVSAGTGVRTSLGAGLSVSQTLYDYSLKRKIRRAELNEIASMANYETKRLDVVLALRKAWFTAYQDQVKLYVLRDTVDNKKLRLNQAKGLYEGGSKARIDVATAESDVSQAELNVIAQETQLGTDWIKLNSAMGKPSPKPYRLQLDSYWDQGIDLTEEQLANIALSCRPELLALQAQLRAQLYTMELADASKYPSLRASASVNESGNMTPMDGTWNVGVSLNWTLFDGFLSNYEKESAKSTARQLAEQFEQQRLTVYSEVMSKAVVMRQAAVAVQAAESGLVKARESYRLASARYDVGVGESLEVSDAEVSLSQAQLAYVTAASTYREAKAELLRAIGVDDLDHLPVGLKPVELDPIPGVAENEEEQ